LAGATILVIIEGRVAPPQDAKGHNLVNLALRSFFGQLDRAMAEIVNLNRLRKAQKRATEERQAEANRVKFGRTKAEKQNDRSLTERRRQDIDGKKLED
jgi:hypothetical protein